MPDFLSIFFAYPTFSDVFLKKDTLTIVELSYIFAFNISPAVVAPMITAFWNFFEIFLTIIVSFFSFVWDEKIWTNTDL